MNFKEAQTLLQQEINTLNFGDQPDELYAPMRYLMNLGGKRLRPMLVLLSTYLFDDHWQKFVKAALAVEVFHNFTLMHDDVMDNAPIRRGKTTVHEKWNTNVAILSGDVMLLQSFQILFDSVAPLLLPQVLQAFNRCATEVCEGQQTDMNFEGLAQVHENDYMNMIKLKTAVLLGFSLQLGAICGGANIQQQQLLRDFGVEMGLGFQLKDDLLDVYGGASFGKLQGGDIVANKKTFLLINALERANEEQRVILNHWLAASNFDKSEKVNAIMSIYNQLDIKTITEQKINACFANAFEHLEKLEVNKDKKQFLKQFAEDLMQREN